MSVLHGDCLAVMPTLDAESVDAIVSDPPYGLGFMGKEWDHGVPGVDFWREALRVAKPGAYLVAFGGTRTYHRLTCAIEDAGWEIRDCLSWLYGSGFPKSMNVSKALEAHETMGGSHTVMMRKSAMGDSYTESDAKGTFRNGTAGAMNSVRTTPPDFTPTTDLARQWQGWGTALKPSWEPIILARKPLVGTVAANVAQYGTGGINVDGCRIKYDQADPRITWQERYGGKDYGAADNAVYGPMQSRTSAGNPAGRWPANVVLDEEAAELLDAQTGEKGGGFGVRGRGGKTYANGDGFANSLAEVGQTVGYGDSGGASRFFYTAKASRREREAGLEGMPRKTVQSGMGGDMPTDDGGNQRDRFKVTAANVHPTVKPIALMRWLCRLVTPPNGLILDPFTGSGSTGCAAVLEGFRFVGIEREAEYVAIAEKRIAHWAAQREEPEPDLFTESR